MKILAIFIMIVQFTDGSVIQYLNQEFNSLKDCTTYQRLHKAMEEGLIGQFREDKVDYKPDEFHTLKEIHYATGICKAVKESSKENKI